MNENMKGQNTLYVVIGVATLVVAIIGATFAYFSAQATAGSGIIQGGTNDVGGALTLEVNRLIFFDSENPAKPSSDELIPADFNLTENTADVTAINGVLTSKCVDNSYTGCHVYKISAHSTQEVAAKLLLQKFTVDNATDKDSWSYIVYKGTDTTEDNVTSSATATEIITSTPGTFASSDLATSEGTDAPFGRTVADITMKAYNEEDPTTVYDYYLLIYLANKKVAQNNTEDPENNGVGRYSGSVLLDAGSGSGLVASFNHS